MITLIDVKRKVEKFRWENKKKSYDGELQNLKSLYWHIVAHEILGDDKLKSNNWEYKSNLLDKIVTTYSGIFFWHYEIEFDLKKKFDGLNFTTINSEKSLWDKWFREVQNKKRDMYVRILHSIKLSVGHGDFMEIDLNFADRPFNLDAFLTHYTNKTMSVSSYLGKHHFYEKNTAKIPELPIVYFRYSLKDKLVERLHSFGVRLMKEALLHQVLSEYDKQFQEIKEINIDLKAGKKRITKTSKKISTFKKMTLKEALDDILSNNLWAKLLTPEQLKYHIIVGYRDQAGREFKNDAVYYAIRRGGYGAYVDWAEKKIINDAVNKVFEIYIYDSNKK